MLSITRHLSLDFAGHTFLNHESVHVDVRLKAATICWIGKTVVFEVLLDLKCFFLLDEHLVVALDGASFQIELLLDRIDPRLVLVEQHIQLIHIHLAHGTVIVGHSRVDGALGAWDSLRGPSRASLNLMLLAQFLKRLHCLAL